MAAIQFPNSPSSGDNFTASNGITYTYDGEKWNVTGDSNGIWNRTGTTVSLANAGDDLNVDSNTLFVDASTNKVGIGTATPTGAALEVVGGQRVDAIYARNSSSGATIFSGTLVDGISDPVNVNIKNTGDAIFLGDLTISDKIIHSGDTNTAIRFPSADTVSVETAGTERFRIDSSGRLLLGTTNAVAFGSRQVLAVANGTTGGVLSLYNSTTATANPRISSNPTGSEINDIGIHAASTNGNIIAYTNNDTEKARIDSAGRLLVGTISAGSNGTADDLVVANDGSASDQAGITIRGGTSGRSQIFFSDGTSGDAEYRGMLRYDHSEDSMQFRTAATERLRILSDGKIGVGTTSPASNLDFGVTSNNASIINLRRNVGGGTTSVVSLGVNAEYGARIAGPSDATAPVSFGTISTSDGTTFSEKMRLDSAGHVAIGSTTTFTHFSVVDGTVGLELDPDFGFNSRANTGTLRAYDRGNSVYRDLGFAGAEILFGISDTEKMRIDASGRLLLNGGSDVRMELGTNGTTGTNDRNHLRADGDNLKYNTCDNGNHIFEVNGNERLKISSAGDIGIGTSSPVTKLDVRGNIYTGDKIGINTTTFNHRIHAHEAGSGTAYFQSTNASSGEGEYDGIVMGLGSATDAYFWNYENGGIHFATNASSRVTIRNDGNFGVGTTSPNQKVEVRGASETNMLLAGTTSTVGGYLYLQNLNATDGNSMVIEGQDAQGNGTSQIKFVNISHNNNEGRISFSTRPSGGSNTERMRIDSDGVLTVISGAANKGIDLLANGSRVARFAVLNPGVDHTPYIGSVLGNGFYFITNNTERMRIGSGGTVMVNTTTNHHSAKCVIQGDTSASVNPLTVANANTSSDQHYHIIMQRGASSIVGSIQTTSSSTAYLTSSDYRLKENVVDITNGITRVKQLQPKRFNFIIDDTKTLDGFLAHEAQTVVPEAVTGTKDEVDDEGNAVMQGIDQAKFVPLLTAALQEAIAKIETLESRITTLENA